jgi:hypothetical protein
MAAGVCHQGRCDRSKVGRTAAFLQHVRVNARFLSLAVLSLAAFGCARPHQSPSYAYWPAPPSALPAELAPGQEVLPAPASAASASPSFAKLDPMPRPAIAPIPGGDACIAQLEQRGVAFSRRQGERGVATPVLVNGTIGGVKFFSDATPFIADCRLVVALFDLAPELVEQGVSQVRFSGAYVYRVKTTGSGRLSLHAYGLAIDVHDVWLGSERLNVKVNFTKGLGKECQPGLPRLNTLVCRIRERRLFKELLTPDDNADHHDHFHFGLAPLPNEIPPEPPPVILRKPTRKAPSVLAEHDDDTDHGKPKAAEKTKVEGKLEKPEKTKPEKAKLDKSEAEKTNSEKGKVDKAKAEKSEKAKAAKAKPDKVEKAKPEPEPEKAKPDNKREEEPRPAPPKKPQEDAIAPIESADPEPPGALPETPKGDKEPKL